METLAKLADKEAQRLWHMERCKPKEHKPRPVGRPRLTPEARKAREIAKIIGNVYVGLRERVSPDFFERRHGEDYRRLGEAIKHDDLDTLLAFEREQPWVDRYN